MQNARMLTNGAARSARVEMDGGLSGRLAVTGERRVAASDGSSSRHGPAGPTRSARWILLRVNRDWDAREIEDYVRGLRSRTRVGPRRLPRDTARVPRARLQAWALMRGCTPT
jgi:hypothetical protein